MMTKPVRIAYVVDVLDTAQAGTENQLIKMLNGLGSRGFEISLICLRNHPWLMRNAASLSCDVTVFEIHRFKSLKTYFNIIRLIIFFRARRPDIVHTFFPVANVIGVVTAWLAGIRNIVSSRRDYGEWMIGGYLLATRIANLFARKIIANSHPVKDLTISAEKVANEKVAVIYNGIDLTAFSNITPDLNLKQRLGIPIQNKVVGKVANFRPMKHHHTFVMAASAILKVRDDIDFLLVGTDAGGSHLRSELEDLARSLKISERLHFTGQQTHVIPYLSIVDIGVNCSEGEGLSNAIMEYMATGIPCVVSNSGGNPDLIQDGKTGRLFELDDHEEMAKIILEMLADPQQLNKYVTNARTMVREDMSVDCMLLKYELFYRELISHAPENARQSLRGAHKN
jgi:glycosyltransferase involved in cell wall biosynthesis